MSKEAPKVVHHGNPDMDVSWHSLSADQVVGQLNTHLQNGLSKAEVEKRQTQ